jgi:hypothetical protein
MQGVMSELRCNHSQTESFMETGLDRLKSCSDVSAVRSAVHSLCSGFGSIRRLDILDSSRGATRQAMCFMRMSSAEQETRLARELGVGRFGGDLVFVVDMNTTDAVIEPVFATQNISALGLGSGGAAALI